MSDAWPRPVLPRKEPFRQELWRLVTPTGMPVLCEIVQVETGFEARVTGRDEDDFIGSNLQPTVGRAREVAELLRLRLLCEGFTAEG